MPRRRACRSTRRWSKVGWSWKSTGLPFSRCWTRWWPAFTRGSSRSRAAAKKKKKRRRSARARKILHLPTKPPMATRRWSLQTRHSRRSHLHNGIPAWAVQDYRRARAVCLLQRTFRHWLHRRRATVRIKPGGATFQISCGYDYNFILFLIFFVEFFLLCLVKKKLHKTFPAIFARITGAHFKIGNKGPESIVATSVQCRQMAPHAT